MPVSHAAPPPPLPGAVTDPHASAVIAIRDDGRVVFPARRPAALVVPLALITESAGVLFLISGDISLGIVACLAPAFALLLTGVILRPTLELTREGLVQRQYPFSSLTRWDVIDHVGIVRAGNRLVLGYKLIDGVAAPRRQPAAALLKAAEQPYDGGYFVDSLRGRPDEILTVVSGYLDDPERRMDLPAARR